MGYSHSFFALDIPKLKALYGSKNTALQDEILKANAEDIEANDGFFQDEIEAGDVPDTATAIREIFAGNARPDAAGAMYGYTLQIICSHLGERVDGGEWGVGNVSDHPYDSLLVKSGVPIPIPTPHDFPDIGYLELKQLDQELALAKAPHDKVASDSAVTMSLLRFVFALFGLPLKPPGIDAEAIQEDINAYIETLENAKKLNKGLVSFRH